MILFPYSFYTIIAKVRLKLFGLVESAWSERHARRFGGSLSETRFHWPAMINYTLVLWLIITPGFGHHESSRHT